MNFTKYGLILLCVCSSFNASALPENSLQTNSISLLKTFHCSGDKKFKRNPSDYRILKKGNPNEDYVEGYEYYLSFNNKEIKLNSMDESIEIDGLYSLISFCTYGMPSYYISDDLIMVFGGQDDRPSTSKLVVNVVDIKNFKIVDTAIFNRFFARNLLIHYRDVIYVTEYINGQGPRFYFLIDAILVNGNLFKIYRGDGILYYKYSLDKQNKITRTFDLEETYSSFEYNAFFKTSKDFKKFIMDPITNEPNYWYYVLKDSKGIATCVYSSSFDKPDAYPKEKSKWVCK
jgi:hypothetical protein